MAKGPEDINLPITSFPMRANLPQREPQLLAFWESEECVAERKQAQAGRPMFRLHDGPPYANGEIHIGHAVNKTLKDAVNKSRLLEGYGVHYVPGWDCHGLPIEMAVEKKHGNAGKLGVKAFQKACRESAGQHIKSQMAGFLRLGVHADWENRYATMDPAFEAGIIRAFGNVFKAGYVTSMSKPVHWCTSCRSALAEAETEYQDIESTAVDVFYPAADAESVKRLMAIFGVQESQPEQPWERCGFVAWTTTPWTLPASRALALHPDISYAAVLVEAPNGGKVGGDIWIVAQELLEALVERAGVTSVKILGTASGADILKESLRLSPPWHDTETVPVVGADYVTAKEGTGVVHTAPAHGMDDWYTGRTHELQVDDLLDDAGRFRDQVPGGIAGKSFSQANAIICEALKMKPQGGRLVSQVAYDHAYPHCWRHGRPLIFRATRQWFIDLNAVVPGQSTSLLERAQIAAQEVSYEPEDGRERLASMLRDRPDWCISRQRLWGVPIALLIDRESGEPHPRSSWLIDRVVELVEKQGVEAWREMDAHALLDADPQRWEKCEDVLDVWFDSGSTNLCLSQDEQDSQWPADLYLEGSDQHRGWFQSSLLVSMAVRDKAPYRGLLTHKFVVNNDGDKMSKSKGNAVAPASIIDHFGADVLRLWVLSTDFRTEMVISQDILKQTAELYRRFRNSWRYILGNIHDLDISQAPSPEAPDAMVDLDLWILQQCQQVIAQVRDDYRHYRFHRALTRLGHFCTIQLSGFYFDVLKDRLYTCAADSDSRRSGQVALLGVGEMLVRALAPVLSFTCEEVWQQLRQVRSGPASVFCATWEDTGVLASWPQPEVSWSHLLHLRSLVNQHLEQARQRGEIGSGQQAQVEVEVPETSDEALSLQQLFSQLGEELPYALLVSDVRFVFIKPRTPFFSHSHGEQIMHFMTADNLFQGQNSESQPASMTVRISRSDLERCARCWYHRKDIDASGRCQRCRKNLGLEGEPEQRRYV